VSPSRPSFRSQLDPFPHSPQALSPLSTAFTPNRSLTPLSTAFTQTHRGVGYQCVGLRQSRTTRHDFIRPLFSYSYKSIFQQPISFQIHANPPGMWHGTRPSFRRVLSKITIRKREFNALLTTFRMNTCRMNTCKSVSKQRTLTTFRMNTYAKTGGEGTYGPHARPPVTIHQSLHLCLHAKAWPACRSQEEPCPTV
jgi:hypothetical protein